MILRVPLLFEIFHGIDHDEIHPPPPHRLDDLDELN